jgi:3-oxoadipate enol-lactonase
MLRQDLRRAIARLTTSVLSVKPLLEGLATQVRVVPVVCGANVPAPGWPTGHWNAVGELLDRVARCARVTGLTLSRDAVFDDLKVFERVVSSRLVLAEWADSMAAVAVNHLGEVDEVAAAAVADSFEAFCHKETITSYDGMPLSVYTVGRGDDAVVVIPACGMPAPLAESWIRFLAHDRRVLTWESRGLFGAIDQHGDYAADIAAQSADLFAVMDHCAVSEAHVLGLCGGAVIALAAAAGRPERISSLSLWHGAYGFASGSPATTHQHGIVELMGMAARSRSAAAAIHDAYCQVALKSTPADVAHFVLYPYASPELFYRYCRLNTGITGTDVEQYLAQVRQPTLVVTSEDDQTAHPDGSKRVAARLANASLRVRATGDHISLFDADETLLRIAGDFISRHEPGCVPPGKVYTHAAAEAEH